jgi:metal-responsive CopG/Arc/MetJ family transcriptional regulator
MDESLIEQIDRAAEHMGQSRSAFLADAARARLKSAA